MSTKRFAAFIITFERPDILPDTIQTIFAQSLPPEKILIVDNSVSTRTEEKLKRFDPRVSYHRVGYNSGPAGGARIGLEMLAKEGYKWIFWGDDDDPPPVNNCFELLVNLAEGYPGSCGQVGMVGHKYNKFTGLIKRTTNEEIFSADYLEVDFIGGGMCKIINSEVILKGVVPEEKLFFGFEDLDFDLAIKKAGYKNLVHCKLFLFCRQKANRMYAKRRSGRKKDLKVIWREYYSIRNNLFITIKNKYYFAFLSSLLIVVLKSLISFKHGFKYGVTISKNAFRAVHHFGIGKYYKV